MGRPLLGAFHYSVVLFFSPVYKSAPVRPEESLRIKPGCWVMDLEVPVHISGVSFRRPVCQPG